MCAPSSRPTSPAPADLENTKDPHGCQNTILTHTHTHLFTIHTYTQNIAYNVYTVQTQKGDYAKRGILCGSKRRRRKRLPLEYSHTGSLARTHTKQMYAAVAAAGSRARTDQNDGIGCICRTTIPCQTIPYTIYTHWACRIFSIARVFMFFSRGTVCVLCSVVFGGVYLCDFTLRCAEARSIVTEMTYCFHSYYLRYLLASTQRACV